MAKGSVTLSFEGTKAAVTAEPAGVGTKVQADARHQMRTPETKQKSSRQQYVSSSAPAETKAAQVKKTKLPDTMAVVKALERAQASLRAQANSLVAAEKARTTATEVQEKQLMNVLKTVIGPDPEKQ